MLAPCCWLQTLDVHASPLASELRAEIHQRLAAGEGLETVETDLVARYGEAVRAIPRGTDPRPALGLGSLLLMMVAGALLFGLFARRVRTARRARARPEPIVVDRALDAYEHRLDEELAAQSH